MSSLSDCVAITISPWSSRKRRCRPRCDSAWSEVARRQCPLNDDLALGHGCRGGLVRGNLRRLELLEVAPTTTGPPLGRAPPGHAATATGRWGATGRSSSGSAREAAAGTTGEAATAAAAGTTGGASGAGCGTVHRCAGGTNFRRCRVGPAGAAVASRCPPYRAGAGWAGRSVRAGDAGGGGGGTGLPVGLRVDCVRFCGASVGADAAMGADARRQGTDGSGPQESRSARQQRVPPLRARAAAAGRGAGAAVGRGAGAAAGHLVAGVAGDPAGGAAGGAAGRELLIRRGERAGTSGAWAAEPGAAAAGAETERIGAFLTGAAPAAPLLDAGHLPRRDPTTRGLRRAPPSAAGAATGAASAALVALPAFLAGAGSSGWTGRRRPSASALRRTRSAWASSMEEEWLLTPYFLQGKGQLEPFFVGQAQLFGQLVDAVPSSASGSLRPLSYAGPGG